MTSQWDCIRKNLGEWQGSFTQVSPQGQLLGDTPSRLTLVETEADRLQLTLIRQPPGQAPTELVRSFSKPGPGPLVPFFETGAFCQGSSYWSPGGQTGAELALTAPERRLRLVLLYAGSSSGQSQLSDITLIRESRAGSGATESPKLTLAQLLGTWRGRSVSLFPTGRQSEAIASELTLQQEGDLLKQLLRIGERAIPSSGRIQGDIITFDSGPQPVQVLLLPGGGSATCPRQVQPQQPFFLEVGWLLDASHRQRLIRHYDAQGNWESVTLVQEEKVS